MELNIWINKGYKNVKKNDFVKTFRALTSFSVANCLRNCIVKSQGGYYKLELNGVLTFKFASLHNVTFEELFNILKD